MNILSAEAGKLSNAKYVRDVNGKSFSYIGSSDEGKLIEEIVFNALIDNVENPEFFKSNPFQALVEMSDKVLLITYNDNEEGAGEDTLDYSLEEFSEQEIMAYLREYLLNKEDLSNLVFVIDDQEDEMIHFSRESDNLEFSLLYSEIRAETLIAGSKKVKMFLKRNLGTIMLIVFIILTPLLSLGPAKKYAITDLDNEINRLTIEEQKTAISKRQQELEIEEIAKKYFKIKKEKDVFSDVELMKELLDLRGFLKPKKEDK
jgi:hypothetical protein